MDPGPNLPINVCPCAEAWATHPTWYLAGLVGWSFGVSIAASQGPCPIRLTLDELQSHSLSTQVKYRGQSHTFTRQGSRSKAKTVLKVPCHQEIGVCTVTKGRILIETSYQNLVRNEHILTSLLPARLLSR